MNYLSWQSTCFAVMPFSNVYIFILFAILFVLSIPLEKWLIDRLPGYYPKQQKLHLARMATASMLAIAIGIAMLAGWLPMRLFMIVWAPTYAALQMTAIMAGIALLFTAWLKYRNIRSERPQDSLPFVQCGWVQYTLVWVLYLFVYETGMRGILMPWQTGPALGWLAGNSLFYALVHLHRGRRETLGALLFGLVLGFITLQVYSLWPAFAAHVVISVRMDIVPTFKRNKKG